MRSVLDFNQNENQAQCPCHANSKHCAPDQSIIPSCWDSGVCDTINASWRLVDYCAHRIHKRCLCGLCASSHSSYRDHVAAQLPQPIAIRVRSVREEQRTRTRGGAGASASQTKEPQESKPGAAQPICRPPVQLGGRAPSQIQAPAGQGWRASRGRRGGGYRARQWGAVGQSAAAAAAGAAAGPAAACERWRKGRYFEAAVGFELGSGDQSDGEVAWRFDPVLAVSCFLGSAVHRY